MDGGARPVAPRVIAGTGRSGTTWLLDTLAEANGLRAVFEPLHPAGLREAAPFANRWVAPDAEWPELERFMARALSGRYLGLWPDLRTRPDRLFDLSEPKALVGQYRRLLGRGVRYLRERRRPVLVKFIRANLMLGWLVHRFGARVVLVVRHPGGVVASTMKLGGRDWHHSTRLERYRSEPALAPYLARLEPVLGGDPSPVAAHAALWCIENAVPLELAASWGITAVHYESLLLGDEESWKRVLAALDLDRRPPRELLERPSQQAAPDMRRASFDAAQLGRWRETLGERERALMASVLDAFGVAAYSMESPLPVGGGASSS